MLVEFPLAERCTKVREVMGLTFVRFLFYSSGYPKLTFTEDYLTTKTLPILCSFDASTDFSKFGKK
jgi:hypothetical protein